MNKYKLINFLYKNILKPILFQFEPEQVHDFMSNIGHLLGEFKITKWITKSLFSFDDPILHQKVGNLEFKNPIGLSAGFDKNAKLLNILPSVGFGFSEIGSVTFKPYAGNPKPRLFRLPKSKALVVYYGLMNEGVLKIVEKFKKVLISNVAGISIAKTNSETTATQQEGILDYYNCIKFLEESNTGDFYTINISCPNTFGGEPFTTEESLRNLLSKLSELNISKPVFIKMPINLEIEQFDKLLKIIVEFKITGVVIGNLTKIRDPKLVLDKIPENIKGNISGKPTFELSNELISYTYKNYGKRLIIVGVGGIFNAQDAYEKIKRGSSLLELITGMIYEGPQLIGQINKELVKLLKADGYSSVSEAVGAYYA